MTTQADPLREACYPEREIFAYGRYINCQIMNWREGSPPQYLVCNPLDANHRETFLATQGMGTWMRVDESGLIRLIAALAQSPAPQGEACTVRLLRDALPYVKDAGEDESDHWQRLIVDIEDVLSGHDLPGGWINAEALERVREHVVLAIAFLNRDQGTDRAAKTIPQIVNGLAKADEILRAALSTPAPQGEGMREALECAQHVLRTMEILALRDLASPEEVAAATHEAERDGYAYFIGNALQKIHIALSTTPIPSDRAGREEEIARVRHKKRGSTYRVLGKAQVQCEKDDPLTDYEVAVVYQCEQDGEMWVRRVSEFQDGRFEELPAALRQSTSAGIERAAELAEVKAAAMEQRSCGDLGSMFAAQSATSLRGFAKELRSLSTSASRE